MNRRTLLAAVAVLALAALVAWLVLPGRAAREDAGPLAGSGVGGPFALIDQDGRAVTDRDFAGSYRLIYFGYTFCPDVCPLDTQKMAAAMRGLQARNPAKAARVQPIFITVDPARDTPAVLAEYVRQFHPRLIGLTGSEAQVDAAKKAFKVYAQRAGPAGAKDYLVDHSAMIYLMGPDGAPIAFLNHDQSAVDLEALLDRYVR